jgi:hypothetical protein
VTDAIDPKEIHEILAWRPPSNFGPIPSDRDREIGRVVEQLRQLDPAQLAAILGEHYDSTLVPYAQRMASLAIRRRSREILVSGIVASGIAGSVPRVDNRDVIPSHTLLWHSAELLGLDARQEFLSVAEEIGGDGGELLESFTRRTPEKRSLKVMYYEESQDGDGFVYRRVPRAWESRSAQPTPKTTADEKPTARTPGILARLRAMFRTDPD